MKQLVTSISLTINFDISANLAENVLWRVFNVSYMPHLKISFYVELTTSAITLIWYHVILNRYWCCFQNCSPKVAIFISGTLPMGECYSVNRILNKEMCFSFFNCIDHNTSWLQTTSHLILHYFIKISCIWFKKEMSSYINWL